MTEDEIKHYLRNRGCSEFVCQGGSERLLRKWNYFVAEVEKGYCPNCLIDEYWNDLDTRELIHEIGCDDRVRETDARFAAMLTATHIKHWHKKRNTDYDFWNYGYPKNASGYFLEEVRRYILREPER
ncbi:MAG TPA: hypothetical protein VJV96_15480 [Candidatus Angelobacter sp.]|jgi:hypothetical protein|nr:hypothetical protein [Candidatus Angelobacter sp.]